MLHRPSDLDIVRSIRDPELRRMARAAMATDARMLYEKRQRLLSVVTKVSGSAAAVQLAAGLSTQNQGYTDTATLNGLLYYADGTAVLLGSDQYLPVVIDPATANAEEAYIVSTPSGSPVTCSIVRGVGSSHSAPSHLNGGLVMAAPTPYDRLLSVDDPWGGNLGLDYEMQGDTTSLPSWSFDGTSYSMSWVNQNSKTWSEAWGRGCLTGPTGANSVGGIVTPLSAFPSTWALTTKAFWTWSSSASASSGGLLLYDSSSGKLILFGPQSNTTQLLFTFWSNYTTQASYSGENNIIGANPTYLRIQQTATNTFNFLVANDGINYVTALGSYNTSTSFSMSPTHVGFGVNNNSSALPFPISFQFFRVR